MYSQTLVSFSDIPTEVIIRILHFCTFKTILRFVVTCKRGREIVARSVSLQLHIELDANGLEVVEKFTNVDVTQLSILEELRRYRDAWLDFDIGPPVEQVVSKQRILLWELREGAFVKAFASTRPCVADSIQVIPLVSPELPTPIKFQDPFHEFTLDLGQQLIALVAVDLARPTSVRINLCSLITGTSHPLAQQPSFTVELDFPIKHEGHSSIALEIMEDFLVIQLARIETRSYEVLVWNWKTTSLINRISSQTGICNFALIDRQHLILYTAYSDGGPTLHSVALLVYNDITSPRSDSCIPPDAHFIISNYPTLGCNFVFNFPKIRSPMSVLPSSLGLRSDPIPGRTVYSGSSAFACLNVGVLGLILPLSYSGYVEPQDFSYRIFVSTSHLLDYMEQHTSRGATELPWAEWGERSTRWFNDEKVDWINWISGSRYLRCSPGSAFGTEILSICDFSTPTVQRHSSRKTDLYLDLPHASSEALRGRGVTPESRWSSALRSLSSGCDLPKALVSENSVFVDIVEGSVPSIVTMGFENPVISRLPYRSVTRPSPVSARVAWLIEGNHIIGTGFRSGSGGHLMIVHKLRTPTGF